MKRTLRPVVAFVCGYEFAALTFGHLPTLSHLSKRHRWVAPVVLGGLAYHF